MFIRAILLVVVFAIAQCWAVNDGNALVVQFHENIMGPKPDLSAMKEILNQMSVEDKPFALNFMFKDENMIPLPPFLHHLLNLYMASRTTAEKAQIFDIFQLGLERGMDPSLGLKNDPPLFFKAVFAKEFGLLHAALRHGRKFFVNQVIARSHWMVGFFNILYAVPSEVVPICKLVLHVEKLVHSQRLVDLALNRTDVAKQLLSAASLGKPSVKAAELLQYSPRFRALVDKVSQQDYVDSDSVVPDESLNRRVDESKQILLEDVIASLDELTASVQTLMLEILREDPRRDVALAHFVDLLVTANPAGRNAFHFLALSGSHRTLQLLFSEYNTSSYFQERLGVIEKKDVRSHSPRSYCVYRFGEDHALCRFLANALHAPHEQTASEMGAEVVKASPVKPVATPAPETAPQVLSQQSADQVAVAVGANGESSEVETDYGGWDPTLLRGSQAMGDRCDLLEVWNADRLPNNTAFFLQHINSGTPVVFRGLAHQPTENMRVLLANFAKARFVKRYGQVEVAASVLPYGDSFGVATETKTLAEVADSPPARPGQGPGSGDEHGGNASVSLYAFQTPGPTWAKKMVADVPVPRSLKVVSVDPQTGTAQQRSYDHELQFYLGAAGTGAPVHVHGHAINTLAYGEKQWVLYPPRVAFYSTLPARRFFERFVWGSDGAGPARDVQALRCTQRAGDIMYVPSLWAHGTLNVRQSIGVAHEFSVEQFCME